MVYHNFSAQKYNFCIVLSLLFLILMNFEVRSQNVSDFDSLGPNVQSLKINNKTIHYIDDGEKTDILRRLIKIHQLEDCVELLGGIPHDDVCYVMNRGHIFLNTSLTETFCLSMLEAASCGLLVVSTNVGGIPEVLPPGMAYLAKPNAVSLTGSLMKAIKDFDNI